jgi:hypothetical protein
MKDRHTNGVALLGKSHINDGYIIKTRNTKMYVSVSVCVCERERERERSYLGCGKGRGRRAGEQGGISTTLPWLKLG